MADTELNPDDQTLTCPFCKDALSKAKSSSCLKCKTLHHVACWKTSGRCSVYGCDGKNIDLGRIRSQFRRIAILFVTAVILRAVLMMFFMDRATLSMQSQSFVRAIVYTFIGLYVAVIVIYILYSIVAVRAAKALEKDPTPYIAYFVGLPFATWLVAQASAGIISGIIGVLLTASPLAVYLLLSREMEEEAKDLSLFR